MAAKLDFDEQVNEWLHDVEPKVLDCVFNVIQKTM